MVVLTQCGGESEAVHSEADVSEAGGKSTFQGSTENLLSWVQKRHCVIQCAIPSEQRKVLPPR